MDKTEIIELLTSKHGFQAVNLTICRRKIATFEGTNYFFTAKKEGKPIEGSVLYSIEHGNYVVTEYPNQSGYWL